MIRLVTRSAALYLAAVLLATAAPAQPALRGTAQNFSESHLALAREIGAMTGVTNIFDAFLPQFGAQIRQNLVTRPEVAKDLDQVLDSLKPELEKQKQAMVDLAARYYATTFTEPELKELVTYFKTPTGQKYLTSVPRILDALSVETQRWTANVAELMMTRVRAEMAKRGHQL
jgi:hypothetical protein